MQGQIGGYVANKKHREASTRALASPVQQRFGSPESGRGILIIDPYSQKGLQRADPQHPRFRGGNLANCNWLGGYINLILRTRPLRIEEK